MEPYEKLARILRADRDTMRSIRENMNRATGKKGVLDRIIEENEAMINSRLGHFGLKRDSSAKLIYDTLIKKIESDSRQLSEALGSPSCETQKGCEMILGAIEEIVGRPTGFFLKKEKARELLEKEPPVKIIESLGYLNVEELLKKEDLLEIWCALRFIEGSDWLNNTFFRQYEALTPDDFEEREIVLKPLGKKWANAAESFVHKKYHNISHLKELGIIFIIPISLGIPGELMRNFNLLLHYLNEVPFYSDIFKKISFEKESFADNLIRLLRGDVIDERLPASEKSRWLIIQRYLAKDDENDWRLFEPHISPEALHWEKAEGMLARIGESLNHNHFAADMAFWRNLNWVGDYFTTEAGIEVLVSFNLVDASMSLVMKKELIKYLYHHQESLWNKIFAEYVGEDKMEELIKENLLRGYLEV